MKPHLYLKEQLYPIGMYMQVNLKTSYYLSIYKGPFLFLHPT
jgi:hypothetical protein